MSRPRYLIDPNIDIVLIDACVDVTAAAPNPPIMQEAKFVVYNDKVPDGQVVVIKAMAPYALARTSVGLLANESVEMIDPKLGNGAFIFEPRAGGKSALCLSKITRSAMTTAAGATSADTKTGSGISFITSHPFDLVQRCMGNDLMGFSVMPGNNLTVLFSLVPAANAFPLPVRYSIGGAVIGTRRVDYAGILMGGFKMSKQYYDSEWAKAEGR